MKNIPKHNYKEITEALLSGKKIDYYIQYIRQTNFEDDEQAGLKLFLENNNYNIDLLKEFLTPPELIRLVKSNSTKYYKIAASLALVITLGFLIKVFIFPAQTIEKYWVDDEGFKVWMSAPDKNIRLLNGMSYYRIENYKEALKEFHFIPENDTAIYYSGICLLKTKQLDSASFYFKKINAASVYSEKSQYYLSLSLLFNDKKKEGLETLRNNNFSDKELENKKKQLLEDFR